MGPWPSVIFFWSSGRRENDSISLWILCGPHFMWATTLFSGHEIVTHSDTDIMPFSTGKGQKVVFFLSCIFRNNYWGPSPITMKHLELIIIIVSIYTALSWSQNTLHIFSHLIFTITLWLLGLEEVKRLDLSWVTWLVFLKQDSHAGLLDSKSSILATVWLRVRTVLRPNSIILWASLAFWNFHFGERDWGLKPNILLTRPLIPRTRKNVQ